MTCDEYDLAGLCFKIFVEKNKSNASTFKIKLCEDVFAIYKAKLDD
jgi:hypothetical protein